MSAQFRILDYNYLFDSTVSLTPSSEDSSFPASNLQKFHRSKVWRTSTTANVTLVIDLKTIEEIDTFVMCFDPLSFPTVIPSEPFRLQYNATNSWTSPAGSINLDSGLDENWAVLSYFFTSPVSYRYWRILMNSQYSNQLGYMEVSKLFLGKATQLTQMPNLGFSVEEGDASERIFTKYGQMYADSYPSKRSFKIGLSLISEADKNTLRDIYRRLGQVKPLVICLDPTEAMFSDKEEYIFYCYFDEDGLVYTQNFTTYFDSAISVMECL